MTFGLELKRKKDSKLPKRGAKSSNFCIPSQAH